MEYREIGRTGVEVSAICLGTMTFGQQNSEAEGHAQMDYAVGQGINLFDTAELYPMPPKAETQGRTEAIIGSWFASGAIAAQGDRRHQGVGRTKRTGCERIAFPGGTAAAQLKEAVDGSLRRFRTDYIDLYQVHWPDRPMRIFEGLDYVHLTGEVSPHRRHSGRAR